MKKRLMLLCLCLGFMPFVVGCVEDAKADEKNKSEEKAKADSTSTDASKKPKKSLPDFSDLPVSDPLVANVIEARKQVAELEEQLLEQLDELRSVLGTVKGDPQRMRESVEQFIEITTTMREKTLIAHDAINTLNEKTAELSRSSRHLASSYRALAELFRKKARDYKEKKLRDQLLGFAKDYDAVAASIPGRCKSIDAVQKQMPALKHKVKEVNLFLKDVVAFLNTHPSLTSERHEHYSTEIESFAVTFTEWMDVLDTLRKTLRESAVSKLIQDSYRNEVAALKKLEELKREEQAHLERTRQEEVAKAEKAKRDETERQAKLAAENQEKLETERLALAKERDDLAKERERLANAESNPFRPKTPASANSPVVNQQVNSCQYVVYPSSGCTCQTYRPSRVRLFPIFRRCHY